MRRRRVPGLAACALALLAVDVRAEKTALSDDELRGVSGKGIAIAVHLVLNSGLLTGEAVDSRVSAGFTVNGVTTYAIAQNFGGVLDLFSVAIDPSFKPDGTGYLSIGLPGYVEAYDFGVRAIGVQTDAAATINNSLGSVLLNGSATMTGQLNLWAR
jgi:hypothetical protein